MPVREPRKIISDECRDYVIYGFDGEFLCKTCGEADLEEVVWVVSHTKKQIWRDNRRCRKCRNVKRSSYKKDFNQKKDQHLRGKFGLTLEAYHAMLAGQGGKCLGCGSLEADRAEGSRMWPVDHDHATGEIRGILCPGCNQALGLIGDSVATLLQLANYLEGVR